MGCFLGWLPTTCIRHPSSLTPRLTLNAMKIPRNIASRSLILGLCLSLSGTYNLTAGTINGQVSDINTGASVTGATITNSATNQVIVADREGQFRLDDIPAGTVTLRIAALGYPDGSQTVQVPATGVVPVRISLGEKAVRLDQLVVEGYREGWSKAQQQKRNATNIMDVLSTDAAGKLPDNNIGEALARLPGVSLDVDYGEGHFVSIRGISPNLNTVTMNGASLATPGNLGRDGRSTPMDLLGTSIISQVEVIKALTPDMDGTSLGGTINVLTASGFDHNGRFLAGAAQYGRNMAGSLPIYAGDFTYSDVFATQAGRLGAAFSMNYQSRETRRDMFMGQWNPSAGGRAALYEPRLDYNLDRRVKRGATLNLDYRLDDGSRIYLHTFFNRFTEESDKNEHLYTARGTMTQLSPTRVSFPQVRYDLRMISFTRKAEMRNVVFGGSKILGDYKIGGEVGYSHAPDEMPSYRNFSFRSKDTVVPGGFVIDYGTYFPTYDLKNLISTANPTVRQVRGDSAENVEKTKTARVDVQRDFKNWFGDKDGFIKVGAKYASRHRTMARNVNIYTAPGYSLSDFNKPSAPAPEKVMDDRYTIETMISPDGSRKVFDDLLAQKKLVYNASGSLSNAGEDTYDVDEKITAGYGMAKINLTPLLTLIGGARYEYTKAPLTGPLFLTDPKTGAPTLISKTVNFNYGEFLPNIQLSYRLPPSTVIRAAITRTFGRPAYADQVPSSALDNVGGVLTTGNPQLKPYESLNFDLSVDYYLKSGGIISVAAFYKTVDNPIYTYSYVQKDVSYAGYDFSSFTVTSKQNGKSAGMKGVELSAQVPFSIFTRSFIDGFGVDTNVTLMDSSVKVSTRPDTLRLYASPKFLANVGLFYEKYGVSARVAYNYRGDSLDSIGADIFTDVYSRARYFVDAQMSYRATENFSVFVNWQNLTDQLSTSYTGGNKDVISQSYWFGSNIRAGVKFRF